MQNMQTGDETEPKWRRKPECRPDDILDGALIEFQQRGFVGARIEDIAKHAGLSKGTVYLYFSSKEAMLKALVRRSVEPIAAKIKKIAEHHGPAHCDESAAEILHQMMSTVANGIMDEHISPIPLIIIGEAGNFPDLVHYYRDQVINVVMQALKKVVDQGIESGEFRAVKVEIAVRSLMSVMIMQVIWTQIFAKPGDDEFSIQDLITVHLDLFLHGIKQPQE